MVGILHWDMQLSREDSERRHTAESALYDCLHLPNEFFRESVHICIVSPTLVPKACEQTL